MAGQTAKVEPNEIGWMFVPQYYTFVNKEPGRLHCFYTKKSTLIHGTEGEECPPRYGQQEIHERIMSLDYQDCKVYVSNVDSQSSAEGGIIVQVLGEMSNKGERWRKFAQTFFLAEQPNGYFVLNDIFRYLKEDSDEADVPDQDESSNVSLGPPATAASHQAPEAHAAPLMPPQQQAQSPQMASDYGFSQQQQQQHPMQQYQPMNAFMPQQPSQYATPDGAYNMVPQMQQQQPIQPFAHPSQQQPFTGQPQINGLHQPSMPEAAVSERSASPPFHRRQQQDALSTDASAFEPVPSRPHPETSVQSTSAQPPVASSSSAADDASVAAPPAAASVASEPAPVKEDAPAATAAPATSEEPTASTSSAQAEDAAISDPVAPTSAPAPPPAEPLAAATSPVSANTPSSPPPASTGKGSGSAPKTTSWANLASRAPAPTNARGLASFASTTSSSSAGPTPSPASSKSQPLQHVPLASSSTQSVLPSIGENRGPGGKPFRNVCDPNRQVTYTLAQVTPNCFLKNILDHVERQDVFSTLSKRFGPIHDVDLMPDKGCGFVEFTSVDQARRACQACLPVSQGGTGFIQLQKSGWPIVVEPKVHKPKSGAAGSSGAGSASAHGGGSSSSNNNNNNNNSSSRSQNKSSTPSGASASGGHDGSGSNSNSKRQGAQSGGGQGGGKQKGRQNTAGGKNSSK